MRIELTPDQRAFRERVRSLVEREVAPHAALADREGWLPDSVLGALAAERLLDPPVRAGERASGLTNIEFGLLSEELGRACSATRSLVTVHSMAQAAIVRWGSPEQRDRWLPRLAAGQALGALCLSEPGAGSDTSAVSLRAESRADGCLELRGEKVWVTGGQRSDLLLVIAVRDGQPCALIVEGDPPGLRRTAVPDPLGLRGAMQAHLAFEGCRVPEGSLLGAAGAGLSVIAAGALDLGRFSVAWGCVGIAQACLDLAIAHAGEREQFGERLVDHQLVRRMLTEMVVSVESARLLAYQAAYLRDAGSPHALEATFLAKYAAAKAAGEAADHALQIHGGAGCAPGHPVGRHFRDARVMRIIEGTTEIHQVVIPTFLRSGHVPHGGRC